MSVLAFVHIEKAAGTTFIHLLRRNFFPAYMDVRPVIQHGEGCLTAADLRVLSRVNSFLRCIAGHSVQSCSDLAEWRSDIRFVTILRNPIDRYVSQFNYWNSRLGKNVTFDQFLANHDTWNFQTRKIAGKADLAQAKDQLHDRFFHVGIVEGFDEFLLLLARKLRPFSFNTSYDVKNTGNKQSLSVDKVVEKFYDEIAEKNSLDLELYDFVKECLLPKYRSEYGPKLITDVAEFSESNKSFSDPSVKLYFDYMARKLYYEPITGLIRKTNALPYRGSYETH